MNIREVPSTPKGSFSDYVEREKEIGLEKRWDEFIKEKYEPVIIKYYSFRSILRGKPDPKFFLMKDLESPERKTQIEMWLKKVEDTFGGDAPEETEENIKKLRELRREHDDLALKFDMEDNP